VSKKPFLARGSETSGTAKRRRRRGGGGGGEGGGGKEEEKGNGWRGQRGKTKSLNEQCPAARGGQYQEEHQRELKVCKYRPQPPKTCFLGGAPEISGGRLRRTEEAAVSGREPRVRFRRDASKISSNPRSVFRAANGSDVLDKSWTEDARDGCRRDRFASRCAGPAISRRQCCWYYDKIFTDRNRRGKEFSAPGRCRSHDRIQNVI